MEFKKNRQTVILEALRLFKAPDWGSLVTPAFLAEARPTRQIAGNRKAIDAHVKRIKDRIDKVLRNPKRNDPVFRAAQRLFESTEAQMLRLSDDAYRTVLELARDRFAAGYPPRKAGDTSSGDAINWEWMVKCGKDQAADVIIVSRDADYGQISQGQPILNDWLAQEFKERVGGRRRLLLTDKLADALKRVKLSVNKKAAEKERELVGELRAAAFRRKARIEERFARMVQDSAGDPNAEEGIYAVLSQLSPAEAKVLRLEFGADGKPFSLEQIASLMGLSRRQLLRLRNNALRNLSDMIA